MLIENIVDNCKLLFMISVFKFCVCFTLSEVLLRNYTPKYENKNYSRYYIFWKQVTQDSGTTDIFSVPPNKIILFLNSAWEWGQKIPHTGAG
jgi:hypothetical protein